MASGTVMSPSLAAEQIDECIRATEPAGLGDDQRATAVLAFTVAQRTREFGVRMALGADPARVRTMVLRQVGMMTLIGGGVGLLAAVGIGRAAQSLLFQLQGTDPVVLAASAGALALVALGAGLVPAVRASRLDPVRALRYE